MSKVLYLIPQANVLFLNKLAQKGKKVEIQVKSQDQNFTTLKKWCIIVKIIIKTQS